MDEKEREYWFQYWMYASSSADKMAKIARVLNLANQLQVNGCSFDLHIQQVSPTLSGGLTTPMMGLNLFENTGELLAILEITVSTLKAEMEHSNDAES